MEKHIKEDLDKFEEELQKYFEVLEKFCKLNYQLNHSQRSYNNLDSFEFHRKVKAILDDMATKLYGRKLALKTTKDSLKKYSRI